MFVNASKSMQLPTSRKLHFENELRLVAAWKIAVTLQMLHATGWRLSWLDLHAIGNQSDEVYLSVNSQ